MTLIDFKRIERVIKLDTTVFKEIRDDKSATLQCIAVVVGVILLNLFASFIVTIVQFPSLIIHAVTTAVISAVLVIILGPIAVSFAVTLGAIIPHVVAKLLGGKSSFIGYIKVLCYVFVLNVFSAIFTLLTIIPRVGEIIYFILSLILGLAALWYAIIATRETHEISTGKAAIAVLVPIIIILALIFFVIGVAMFSLLGMGAV